jgi:post-segregation antitoxin (ccd killing protein)
MGRIIRGEKTYSNTCLQLPYELKQQAKERGINMSRVLVKAIEHELEGGDVRGSNATNTQTPASLSSTDQQVDE